MVSKAEAQITDKRSWVKCRDNFIASFTLHYPNYSYTTFTDGVQVSSEMDSVFIANGIINRFSVAEGLKVTKRSQISIISAFKRLANIHISSEDGSVVNNTENKEFLAVAAYFKITNYKHVKKKGFLCRCLICGEERYINFTEFCQVATCFGCMKSSQHDIGKARGSYTVNRFKSDNELKSDPTYLYWICFTATSGSTYFKIGIDSTGYRWKKNIGDYHTVDILRLKTTKLIAFHVEQYIIKRYQTNRCNPVDLGVGISGKTEFFDDNMLLTDVESVIKHCIFRMNSKALKHYDLSLLVEKGLLDIPVI